MRSHDHAADTLSSTISRRLVPSCNLHKANRIDAVDPDTGNKVPLFNPRSGHWDEHFRWDGYRIVGQTPIGRATVAALELNHPRRIQMRQAEELFDLHPAAVLRGDPDQVAPLGL